MKEYILLTDDEIENIKAGGEVSGETKSGVKVYIMSKNHYEKWEKAITYLNLLIGTYASLGWQGSFGLNLTLLPLYKRYEGGERTPELYDAIMKCEQKVVKNE